MSIVSTSVDAGSALIAGAFGFAGRGVIAVAGLALVVLYLAALFPAAAEKSGSAANRVVDLQRAHRVDTFVAVLRRWSATNEQAVGIIKRDNIWKLDSSFPALYGLTFAFFYAWASGRTRPTRLDALLFVAPLLAAAFDYVENSFELYALRGIETVTDVDNAVRAGTFSAGAIFAQSACAHIKYVLLLVSLAAIAVALVIDAVLALRRGIGSATVGSR